MRGDITKRDVSSGKKMEVPNFEVDKQNLRGFINIIKEKTE